MDSLKDFKPNALAVTLKVSELKTLIERFVSKILGELNDPTRQQLFGVLDNLSEDQIKLVLRFALDLKGSTTPPVIVQTPADTSSAGAPSPTPATADQPAAAPMAIAKDLQQVVADAGVGIVDLGSADAVG